MVINLNTARPPAQLVDTARIILDDLRSTVPRMSHKLNALSKPERLLVEQCVAACQSQGVNTQNDRVQVVNRIIESQSFRYPEFRELLPMETKQQLEVITPQKEEVKEDQRLIVNKYGKKRFPTFKQSDIEDFPDIEFMIGEFLPTTGVALLVAPSGTGKTYLLIDIANHVARGMNWKGKSVKGGQVLFIYLEGKLGLKPRERAWRKHHELGTTDNIDYMSVSMDLMRDRDYIESVIEEIQLDQGKPYSLIIIDTFSNVTRGVDQNKQELVTMVLEVFHQIADKWQTQVLVTHHTNKQGTANGSMSFKNHVDTMIELSSQDNGPITVHCEKQRDGAPPFADFMLQRQLVELGFDSETMAPVFNCVLIASEDNVNNVKEMVTLDEQERMLDVLRVHTKMTARKWLSACKEVKISYRTFYKHIPLLINQKTIICAKAEKDGQADWYEIAPYPQTVSTVYSAQAEEEIEQIGVPYED